MKDLHYVLENFFTHRDYLVDAAQIPGTLFTPLHFLFEAVLLAVIISGALYVAKHGKLIRPVFTGIWVTLVIWEFVIIAWDSTAGKTVGLDLRTNLSLYPCSIYLYAMPFILWGRGAPRQMACGYLFTLGMMGAVVNFLYPISRLTDYSCISFPGFHTFAFHGSMLFTYLVMVRSGMHSYATGGRWQALFYPSMFSLFLSIPANLINYSPIDADYMYFKGQFPLLQKLFVGVQPISITLILYGLYLFIPAMFYLPDYLRERQTVQSVWQRVTGRYGTE